MNERPRAIEFEHNGQRLRVTKSEGITRERPNAFVTVDGGAPMLLDEYRSGMTIAQVKRLACVTADRLAERRAQIRLELQEKEKRHQRSMD